MKVFSDTHIQIHGGRIVDLADLRVEDIDLHSIATSLSRLCRFNGHGRCFYSVAQHSIDVAHRISDPKLRIYGLIHDAHEAFIGDIATPVKTMFRSAGTDYSNAAHYIDTVIYKAFGLKYPDERIHSIVKQQDNNALIYEAQNYMWSCQYWSYKKDMLFEPLGMQEAADLFLKKFEECMSAYKFSESKGEALAAVGT